MIYENLGFPFLEIVNSFSNFAEAVVGTIVISNLILLGKRSQNSIAPKISNVNVCLLATLLTGFYVISQELKLHNLGGNNIYDPNDVLGSVIGLVFINIVILKFGLSNNEVN